LSTKTNIQPEPFSENASITYADPATLLVDRNVRTDTRLDRDFLASVRDLGVLVPIVAVRTAEGALRVRYGHRRTEAAVEAGHAYVPVVVVADEATDDAAEVERLVGQYAENEHRSGLTTGERVDVFTQLSAFGVSAAQIAKRTKTRRKEVDAALTVAGSQLARAAATRYEFLTLDQAAVVAEFEDDAEAVKALVVAAREGGFEHLAQRLRDERTEAAERAKAADDLVAAGVTVIDRPHWTDPSKDLDDLRDADGDPLAVEAHASCPGHAAYVDAYWTDHYDGTNDEDEPVEFGPVYVCTDPDAYGHQSRWQRSVATEDPEPTDEDKAAAAAERRRVVANNKAWRSAEAVRREWLVAFCARKTPPKGSSRLVADALRRADRPLAMALDRGSQLANSLFGASLRVDESSDNRAQVVALAIVLAAYEDDTGTHSWRNVSDSTARYLRYLASQGYELSDVERLACGEAGDDSGA
jgi:ParB family chromosome partitioning protein